MAVEKISFEEFIRAMTGEDFTNRIKVYEDLLMLDDEEDEFDERDEEE